MFLRQLACQSILGTIELLAWSCGFFHLHLLLGVGSMARIPRSQPHPRNFRTGQELAICTSHQVLDASRLGQLDRGARLLLRGLSRVN